MIELTRDTIDYQALTESVRRTSAGAVVLFLGTVRDLTGEVRTLQLEYEAYEPMAQLMLTQLDEEVRQSFPVLDVAMAHRVGVMDPGEISVAIAVSAPHRAQAFEAGRWLIDTLKERVPVWKKEYYSDGGCEWQHPGVSLPPTESERRPVPGTCDSRSGT